MLIRSLAKYSSEEESDSDVNTKAKKDKNRRATLAAPVMQPPASKTRKSTKIAVKEEVVDIPSTTSVPEIKSTRRRTTRLIKSQTEEFDTGSDSEPEIIEVNDEKASGDKGNIKNIKNLLSFY